MAIGNPFNLAHTVSVGVISAIGRPFPVAPGRQQDVLQTDAAINPGNSGGPLLNIRGEVVGINTAIVSDRASNLGIGFAVPINAVLELLPQLHGGKVTRGRIGVNITAVQREAVELFGLPNTQGAVVASVEPDGPAALGGLEPGDVIVEYNGDLVTDTSDLQSKVTRTVPGTEVPITVMREQERTTLEVTIGELDLEAEAQPRSASNNNEDQSTGFGMTLSDLNGELSRRLGVPSDITGAIIRELEPRGAAAQAGMRQGDIIVEVNRVEVDSARSAVRELQLVDSGEPAFFLIWRDGTETFVQATKE
jgi:serine protease Do